MTEKHFKALGKDDNSSTIPDHVQVVKTTRHNINRDHFDLLAKGS